MADDTADRGKGRTRSSAYPSFGLEEAIHKASVLYKGEGRHWFPVVSMATHLETQVTSSNFQRAISTLKQFGLLEDEGTGEKRRLRLSDLMLDLLEHEGDAPERHRLIAT